MEVMLSLLLIFLIIFFTSFIPLCCADELIKDEPVLSAD